MCGVNLVGILGLLFLMCSWYMLFLMWVWIWIVFGIVWWCVFFSNVSNVWWMCIGLQCMCCGLRLSIGCWLVVCSVCVNVLIMVCILVVRLVLWILMFRWLLLVRLIMCRFLISCVSFLICMSRLWYSVLFGVNIFLVSFCKCLCSMVMGVCSLCVIVVFQKVCLLVMCCSLFVSVLKLLVSSVVFFNE